MSTLATRLIWVLFGALQGYPAIFLPASILYTLLGVFASGEIIKVHGGRH